MIGTAIGLGMGIVGGIGKMIARGKANKEMNALLGKDPSYTQNPMAAQRLGLAQTLLNARTPGAASAEKNIYASQAGAMANANRGATDSSQILAAGAMANSQANNSFNQLAMNEGQDYQRRYNNLEGAQQGMINEGDKVYNDQLRRYGNEVQVRGAQSQNRTDNWQDFSNMGMGLADFGMSGGFKGLFGGNGGGKVSTPTPLQFNGTFGSNVPMFGNMRNRNTPNFG
jgi:hypothetical protein